MRTMPPKTDILIAPSLLAGDFGRLAEEAQRVEAAGADCLHLDVMDGHFVPNLTLGPQVVAAVNRATDLFLDVHLMIYNPFDYVERFVEAGADSLTIHFEATEDVEETLHYIRRCGIQAGLAFCPETSKEMIPPFLPHCDMVLLMTVRPGFGGQAFMEPVLEKVRFIRQLSTERGLQSKGFPYPKGSSFPFALQVDGGVDAKTAPHCLEAGANVLVSGTYLFKAQEMSDAIVQLRG